MSASAAKEKAQGLIDAEPVLVFSKTYCPYCVRVKEALRDMGVSFTAYELDKEQDGDAVQAALAQLSGQRTVPNVFVGGKHVGGCDDTLAAQRNGSLATLLEEAGVQLAK